MSRTYRKRSVSFKEEFSYWHHLIESGDKSEWLNKYYHKVKNIYHTDNYEEFHRNMPKEWRKSANAKRRNHDKRELWKELNIVDYEAQYSKWNCKDNDHWSYF